MSAERAKSMNANNPTSTATQRISLWPSLAYSPTVALAWLWGLGFFYSIHVTVSYGWMGFVAFATPNVLGFFLFGFVLGAPGRDPGRLMESLKARFSVFFQLYQIAAVGLTAYAFMACGWAPLMGSASLVWGLPLYLTLALGVGFLSPFWRLKRMHMLVLPVLIGGGIAVGLALRDSGQASVIGQSFDARFYGLVLPSLFGFLLGPWLDIQHWHRAVEVHRAGQSVRVAYAGGALIFGALLALNAWIAFATGPFTPLVAVDGVASGYSALAQAVARTAPFGQPTLLAIFLTWITVALASMVESSICAAREMGFPAWRIAVGALAVAGTAFLVSPSLMYLIVPFASLFLGAEAHIVLEVLGYEPRFKNNLCLTTGIVSALLFVVGYLISPVLLGLSPLVALTGLWVVPRMKKEMGPRLSKAG